MSYNHRPREHKLRKVAHQYSLNQSFSQPEAIELSTWESPSAPFFEPPPHTYHSTDELLPFENERLYELSPRDSVDGVVLKRKWKGWQLGAALCLITASATLILNVTVTAWAAITFGLSGGIGTIHQGPCHAVKQTGLWLHIAINVLSTILLGASNYCMQCLCSPTRQEVDRAHARKTWLDIGIQSMRNLSRIGRLRMGLWIILAASSIPLHLMFNSAIFVSLTANEYMVAAVTQDFLNGSAWTLTGSNTFHQSLLKEMQQNISTYEKLDQAACITEYGVDYLSSWRNVLVVVDGQLPNPLLGILDWTYDAPENSWTCGTTLGPNMTLETISIDNFDCDISVALGNDTWLMGNEQVDYCLSQKVEDRCRLQFAVPIMVVVLICNFVKLMAMIVTLWKCSEPTLVTLGDALSDLLQRPDPYTVGMCIAAKEDFKDGAWPEPQAVRWNPKKHFRFEGVGIRRWILTNAMQVFPVYDGFSADLSSCAGAVISLSVLLRFAIANTTTASDIATLYGLGFGAVTSSSLIRWSNPIFGSPGLMKNVLLANSPQIILSLLYILYNRMYTCMSFSKEWNDFGYRRRPLRVTSPRGAQHSTYFLSLPYRYLISILSVSVATHWILSQSLFLVAIDVFDEQGNFDASQSILTCGFSCIAMIFLVGIGWLVCIAGVGMGLRRFREGIPLVGSCSAAISAACHPAADEPEVALVPVKWGVVSVADGVGHCALSGRYVSPPVTWRWYRGQ